MKKTSFLLKLIFLLFLMMEVNFFGQNKDNYTKGYENGFKEGYCYDIKEIGMCKYPIIPFVPSPKINENKENYKQGYNRGFQYGLDLKRLNEDDEKNNNDLKQKILSFNQYIPQNAVDAKITVGLIKQNIYNARKDWIQRRLNILNNIVLQLFNEQSIPKDFSWVDLKNKNWEKINHYIISISSFDYADDYQYSKIVDHFDELEDMLYLEYNGLFKQTKNNLVENKIIDAEIFVYRKCSLSAMLSNLKLYKNGKLFVKIPNCKGLKFNVREQGQLILDFSIVMGFYKDRLILNITPSSKKYYIRYECDESSCGYTIVPPEIGSKEYNEL